MSKNIDKKSFEALLKWLNPDQNEAAKIYQQLHQSLEQFFLSKGCDIAEELADEVIDRVNDKVEGLSETYVGNPQNYFYGVAKKVRLEYFRKKEVQLDEDLLKLKEKSHNPIDEQFEEYEEKERAEFAKTCLRECLKNLNTKDRNLLKKYYDTDSLKEKDYRDKLAKKYRMSRNSLGVKVFRLKNQMAECMDKCLNE